jgi:hypothetical protein
LQEVTRINMQNHKQQVEAITTSFQKQLADKDEYIRMLEQMIEGETNGIIQSS